MKITQLELFTVPPRWLFLKITTDEGYIGWGEPIVEGHAHSVKAAVEEAQDFLIGQNPLNIEDLWQKLYRARFYRGGPIMMSAIAGINQALWDIKGKFHGVPIYDLLGGAVRDKIETYSWIGGDRPADVVKMAQDRKASGFNAVKMNATEELHYIDSFDKVEAVVERVGAIRDAMGSSFGIGVDFHGRVHKPMAKVIAKELAPFHLMFIEEPVLTENLEALRDIVTHASTPIATGERMYSRWDFKSILQAGYVDILQPDLSHAGGISEVYKIATMAEAFDVALAPHCPLGPIALASCIQVDAVCRNAFIQEQSLNIHYNQGNDLMDYLSDPDVFAFSDGFLQLPTAPGLGITINEDYVRERAKEGHNWRNPIWSLKDGTVAEW